MADPRDIDEEVLDRIRRAAFELRLDDPQAAVRELRKAASAGGAAEVLARGALGEIYFEEFGDLDGAEHEYRKVLKAAPGLAAAELGLARVLRDMGRTDEAEQHLLAALDGLQRDVRSFREAGQPPPGAEEVVLSLLEVALELAELRKDGVPAQVPVDDELLDWAASARLFDALAADDPEGAAEDWARFHALRARLRAAQGRAGENAAAIEAAGSEGQLTPLHAARLLSEALEDAGDLAAAAAAARRFLDAQKTAAQPWAADDVLRAAALLVASGDDAGAASYLTAALTQLDSQLGAADDEQRAQLEADKKRLKDALEEPPSEPAGSGKRLIPLGLGTTPKRPHR